MSEKLPVNKYLKLQMGALSCTKPFDLAYPVKEYSRPVAWFHQNVRIDTLQFF